MHAERKVCDNDTDAEMVCRSGRVAREQRPRFFLGDEIIKVNSRAPISSEGRWYCILDEEADGVRDVIRAMSFQTQHSILPRRQHPKVNLRPVTKALDWRRPNGALEQLLLVTAATCGGNKIEERAHSKSYTRLTKLEAEVLYKLRIVTWAH